MTESPDDIANQEHRPPESLNTEESSHKLPLTDVFELGIHLEYIRVVTGSESVTAGEIIPSLREVHDTLQKSDTGSIIVNEVGSHHFDLIDSTGSSEGKLNAEIKKNLRVKATTWKHLLGRELAQENRIPVDDTGLLKIDSLIESPEDLFGNVIWDWLDERPRSDIREACRCIVVGCSTASVMMSLRAVEHCLRKWYEEEHEELDAAWGRVLDQLMEEYTEEEKRNDTVLTQLSDLPPVLSNLYYLKEKRNEVSHPDQSPSPQEARRTLMIVASTISEIHDEMRDIAAEEVEIYGQQTIHQVTSHDSNLENGTSRVILEGITEMEKNKDGEPVLRSDIYELGDQLGLSKNEVDNVVTDLLMSGRLYEPSDESVKVI